MKNLGLAQLLIATLGLTLGTGCGNVILEQPGSTDPPPPVSTLPASCAVDPWAQSFAGTTSGPFPGSVAPDGNCGVVFTAGGQTDFGTGDPGELLSLALVRLDPQGHPLWAHHFGHDAALIPPRVAVDPLGNVIIAGVAGSPFDLGGGEIDNIGTADVYVAKFSPEGDLLWARRFGGSDWSTDIARLDGLTVGPAGQVVIAGNYTGGIDFGVGATLAATGSNGAGYVAQLDADGKSVWQRGFPVTGGTWEASWAAGVAVSASGDVVVAGTFTAQIDAGTGPLTTKPNTASTFVATYDDHGKPVWSRAFGGTGEMVPHAAVIDADGDVIVTCRLAGTVHLGDVTLSNGPGFGAVLMKLDSSGNPLLALQLPGSQPAGLATDADRNIIVATTSVIKLDPAGNTLWSRGGGPDGGSWFVYEGGVGVDVSGNVVVTGASYGDVDFDVVTMEGGDGDARSFAANLGQ